MYSTLHVSRRRIFQNYELKTYRKRQWSKVNEVPKSKWSRFSHYPENFIGMWSRIFIETMWIMKTSDGKKVFIHRTILFRTALRRVNSILWQRKILYMLVWSWTASTMRAMISAHGASPVIPAKSWLPMPLLLTQRFREKALEKLW